MIIHTTAFHLCYLSKGTTRVINLTSLQMTLCHSKEITPDPCLLSSTNVNASLICFPQVAKKKKKSFCCRAGDQVESPVMCLQFIPDCD